MALSYWSMSMLCTHDGAIIAPWQVYLQPVWERLQTRQNPGQVGKLVSLGDAFEENETPRALLFGVLRGEGAVMLSYNSMYTYSITNSPCTLHPGSKL